MGWITDSDGLYECGQCQSTKHTDKLKIKHDDGCVQGIMHSAICKFDETL